MIVRLSKIYIRSVNHGMVVTRAHVVTEVSSIQNAPLKAIQM